MRGLAQRPSKHEVEFVEFVQGMLMRNCAPPRSSRLSSACALGQSPESPSACSRNGFDAWNEQAAISRHLVLGAPPDVLNTVGQDWGLAGFNGGGLEAQSFVPFANMVAASMRHAGAIRLDHVLGLKWLHLVRGFKPDNGAYVVLEALCGRSVRESVTHKCIVIGENLGTVREGFRETHCRISASGPISS